MSKPQITDTPPPEVQADLALLREALDDRKRGVPLKLLDRNLVIADWPFTHFRDVIASWHAVEVDEWVEVAVRDHSAGMNNRKHLKRDFHSIRLIAEIVSRFDVVTFSAFSEIFGDSEFFKYILQVLGPNWGLMITDVKIITMPVPQGQRMAVVYDRRRVTPSGLVGDLKTSQYPIGEDALNPDDHFEWSPYLIGFRSGHRDFTIVFVIISSEDALRESKALVKWLMDARSNKQTWVRNPIVIGFVDELKEIYSSAGLFAPFGFSALFDDITGFLGHSYIGWFPEGTAACPALDSTSHGFFNFDRIVPKDDTVKSRVFQPGYSTWHISNACPFWVEFSLRD